jgi:hypothetical protein
MTMVSMTRTRTSVGIAGIIRSPRFIAVDVSAVAACFPCRAFRGGARASLQPNW